MKEDSIYWRNVYRRNCDFSKHIETFSAQTEILIQLLEKILKKIGRKNTQERSKPETEN